MFAVVEHVAVTNPTVIYARLKKKSMNHLYL